MTLTVIARCPRTGRFGIGTASYTMAIGAYCDGAVRPNVGVTITQDAPLLRNNRLAINLLAQGSTPKQALHVLAENDAHYDYRQIAIVDREGAAVAHTGTHLRQECPAAPPTRLSRDELEDRGQQPIAPRSDSPASPGQLKPDAPLHAQ